MSITEILNRYGSDKASDHSYGEIYEDFFAPLRRKAKVVLEIGVYRGASLHAWREIFPQATLVGIDNAPQPDCTLPPQAACLRVNAADRNALSAAVSSYGQLDLVIDDGSHDPEDQRAACDALLKRVRRGGLYVIEDVRSIDVAVNLAALYRGAVLDLRAIKGQWDDILVVFRGQA